MLSQMSIFQNRLRLQRGVLFGALIVTALLAFEVFNYSTTDFALSDLLGNLTFLSVRWATILSIAFCGIDFAGIARLFTPEQGRDEPAEVWYLFGAWMLAALMNAMLTWWGVSIAILNHQTLGNAVVARETLLKVVPIFVAIMVWLIRVLIIGTISVAGDRLFSQTNLASVRRGARQSTNRNTSSRSSSRSRPANTNRRSNPVGRTARASSSFSPAPKPTYADGDYASQEPTYHPVSRANNSNREGRRTQF
ncbi:MAG: hypothetical protein ISS57_11195 [Anaerolineales bacterium]|nr:hypothetical protein [Anaerolineales bacterium]